MTNFVTSVLRTLAQVLVGYLATWLAARGLDIPQQVSDWMLGAIVATGILLYTGALRWLETRKGASGWPVAARKLAALLMLGLARPVYVPAGSQVQAVSDDAGTRSTQLAGPVPETGTAYWQTGSSRR